MKQILADRPIGVFDSGVGGLTVARRILEVLPNERIVYVADQAHVPYGGRELAEVRGFACGISAALFEAGCKAIVMACNISSAVALDSVHAAHPEETVLGVIKPGACRAAGMTRNGRIGVLATVGTVQSRAYTRALHGLDPRLEVAEVACPEFVPLVEANAEGSPAALRAAEEFLTPLQRMGADTVILGCTHYPFLLPVLREVWSTPGFVDPAEQTSAELADQLASACLLAHAPLESRERHLLTTTGNASVFRQYLSRFLPDAARSARVEGIQWREGCLSLLPVSNTTTSL